VGVFTGSYHNLNVVIYDIGHFQLNATNIQGLELPFLANTYSVFDFGNSRYGPVVIIRGCESLGWHSDVSSWLAFVQ
jgi:hypothetical protein